MNRQDSSLFTSSGANSLVDILAVGSQISSRNGLEAMGLQGETF
jgi:hypothetical protein